MRKIFNTIKAGVQAVKEKFVAVHAAAERRIHRISAKIKTAAFRLVIRSNTMLAANRGENFVDSGIKILIAALSVVCGLWGSYALLLFAQIAMLIFYGIRFVILKLRGKTADKALPFVPFIFIGYLCSTLIF